MAAVIQIVNVVQAVIKLVHSVLFILVLFLTGCQVMHEEISPCITYIPSQTWVERTPSAFAPLSSKELKEPWGQELKIATHFAREMDLYRAITTYKRALFLDPPIERMLEIQYGIIQCYYLGQKYAETIEYFESSALTNLPVTFPATEDLLIILSDSYQKSGQGNRAAHLISILESRAPVEAIRLKSSEAILKADFSLMNENNIEMIDPLLQQYASEKKSVQKARILNAILPGAGYFYVGQKQSAVTSFIINSLFITAAYTFFEHGYVAAGIITTSLEVGWYYGGINGAGLGAKEFNERLYEGIAKEHLLANRLFPVLMLQYAF